MAAKNLPTNPNRLPLGGWLGGEPKGEVLPTSPNRLPLGGWLKEVPKSEVLPTSPNRLLTSWGWIDTPETPIVYDPLPIGGVPVSPETTIVSFRVKQIKAIADIDISTLDVSFSFNGGAPVVAVLNNTPQNGYSHTTVDESTSLESIYYVEVTPPTDWPENSKVSTSVEIEDDAP